MALRQLGQQPIVTLGEDTETYRKVNDVYALILKSMLRSHPWSFAKKEVALSRAIATDTADWVTTTSYAIGVYVISGTTSYGCLVAHGSGTFSTDLAAGKWAAATDYEAVVLSDYAYIFDLPNDLLRLNKTSVQPTYSHKIKGRQLYSNSDTVSIEYVALIEDPTAWASSTTYLKGEYVLQSNTIYYCLRNHTSGTFATDLANSLWTEKDKYDSAFTDAFATRLAFEVCYAITQDADLLKVKQDEFKTKFNYAKSLNGQEVTPDSPQEDEWTNARV